MKTDKNKVKKMDYDEIYDFLENAYNEHGTEIFCSLNYFKDFEKVLGKIELVEDYGGEDCGSEYYHIFHIVDHNVYVRFDGYYQSYNGVEYESFCDTISRVYYRKVYSHQFTTPYETSSKFVRFLVNLCNNNEPELTKISSRMIEITNEGWEDIDLEIIYDSILNKIDSVMKMHQQRNNEESTRIYENLKSSLMFVEANKVLLCK